jgi:MFS family permease
MTRASGPTTAKAARPPLYTLPFIGLCATVFAGFAQNNLLQPILPLFVLELGGDASIAGLAFLLYSIPAVGLRPYLGRLTDRIGARRALLLGAIGLAAAGPFYLLPSLAFLLVLRFAHGTAWAAFATGAPSTLASLAPAERRGEASAAFDVMPALAALTMPTVALAAYAATGVTLPLVIAAGMGVGALVVSARLVPRSLGGQVSAAGPARADLIERSALVAMVYQLLLSMPQSLFVVYPPLFAAAHGIPLTELLLYYPVFGIVFVVSRILGGPLVDRVPHSTVLLGTAGLAIAGLVVAAAATNVAVLTIGGVLYATANGASSPATTALVIERAPPGRIGAAMATYTVGFQFGGGFGAAIWGVLIDAAGFVLPCLVAAGLAAAALGVALARRSMIDGPAGGAHDRDSTVPRAP